MKPSAYLKTMHNKSILSSPPYPPSPDLRQVKISVFSKERECQDLNFPGCNTQELSLGQGQSPGVENQRGPESLPGEGMKTERPTTVSLSSEGHLLITCSFFPLISLCTCPPTLGDGRHRNGWEWEESIAWQGGQVNEKALQPPWRKNEKEERSCSHHAMQPGSCF